MNEVTRVLSAIEGGDPHAAEKRLPLVYQELRQLERRVFRGAQKMCGNLRRESALRDKIVAP